MNHRSAPAKSIVVNGRFLSQPVTGVQRYALELLKSLDKLLAAGLLEGVPITVLIPANVKGIPDYSFLHVRQVGHQTGQLWEQIDLPFFARGSLLFTPCGGAPVLHTPHVITIHDAGIFNTPQAYTAIYKNYYKILQRHLARTATHIITVSEFSKRELARCLRVPDQKISCTYESGEHILRCEQDLSILTRHGLEKGRYVLAVGSQNPNKNFNGLIQACALLPRSEIQIAIAGRVHSTVFGGARFPAGSAKELGTVSDSELRALYENAACFAFPSLYEGFGLPPLEALTLGCPVVVSHTASLPEIFGEAAVYCEPHSPRDIAEKIFCVLRGDRPNRESALEHASKFTWECCARQTWEILSATIES